MRARNRAARGTLLAAALVAASLAVGGWKVVGVRQENARLAASARECRARNEAFLALIRAAGLERSGDETTPSPP
jgi:hypothetical protein